MTPEVTAVRGLRPVVPAGADAADMMVARAANGVLGSLNTQTRTFVPAVAQARSAAALVPALAAGPLLPLLGVATVGLGVFNGVMSWKINKKLNRVLEGQNLLSRQFDAGFLALRQAQDLQFGEMRAAIDDVEQRLDALHLELERLDLRQLLTEQNKLLLALEGFTTAQTVFDAEQLLIAARDAEAMLRAHNATTVLDPEGAYPIVLARVQALVATADARFFLASRAPGERENHLKAAAAARWHARQQVSEAALMAARQTMWQSRDLDVPLVVMYWHLAQGLDATAVEVESTLESSVDELVWQDRPWHDLKSAMTASEGAQIHPGTALHPGRWDEWTEWRRLQSPHSETATAVTAGGAARLLGLPDRQPLHADGLREALKHIGPAWIDLAADIVPTDEPILGHELASDANFTEYDIDALTASMHEQLNEGIGRQQLALARRWALDTRSCLEPTALTHLSAETDAARCALFGDAPSLIDEVTRTALETARSLPDADISIAALQCLARLNRQEGRGREAVSNLVDATRRDPGYRRASILLWRPSSELAAECRQIVREALAAAEVIDLESTSTCWRDWRTANDDQLVKEEAAFNEARLQVLAGRHILSSRKQMKTRRRRYANLPGAERTVLEAMDSHLASASNGG